jgi:hypothetical protein
MYITFLMFGTTSVFSQPAHQAKHFYTPVQLRSSPHRSGSSLKYSPHSIYRLMPRYKEDNRSSQGERCISSSGNRNVLQCSSQEVPVAKTGDHKRTINIRFLSARSVRDKVRFPNPRSPLQGFPLPPASPSNPYSARGTHSPARTRRR